MAGSVFKIGMLIFLLGLNAGCRTPEAFRRDVDAGVRQMVAQTRSQILEKTSEFSIEKPGDTLRRQLLEQLSLPVAGPVSLGTGHLVEIPHWPEPGYPAAIQTSDTNREKQASPLTLSLFQSLEIGAQNSFEFQTRKEAVFQSGLALYLEQDFFEIRSSGRCSSCSVRICPLIPTGKGPVPAWK